MLVKEEKTMNYVVKDLPEINLVEELLKYDPDIKEKLEMKLEMENENTVIDNKKKIKHTDKNIIVCGDRSGKGVSVSLREIKMKSTTE